MLEMIKLACASCGASLEVAKDVDHLACGHCGAQFVVRRSGAAISLAPIVEGLKRVEVGIDRTASELAIARLNRELVDYEREGVAAETAARLSAAKARNASRVAGAIAIVGMLFMLAGVVGRVVANSDYTTKLVIGLVGIVGGVVGIRQFNRDETAARQSYETKRLALYDKISHVKQEIAKHHEIVR
jgi:ribosomal protein S27AE